MTEWTPQGEPEQRSPVTAPPPLYVHNYPEQATYPYTVQPYVARFADGPPRRPTRLDRLLRLLIVTGTTFVVMSVIDSNEERSRPLGFIDIPVIEPAGAAGALPLDEAERFVAEYEPSRDAHGSYVESAQELTRVFGAELVWGDYSQPDLTSQCVMTDDDPLVVLAWFCPGEPYLIHLNSSSHAMPGMLYNAGFIDAIKHELAHLIIDRRWCHPLPIPDETESEGITNSYADLYLGADRDVLSDVNESFPEYTMTPDTDAAAAMIHGDTCQ